MTNPIRAEQDTAFMTPRQLAGLRTERENLRLAIGRTYQSIVNDDARLRKIINDESDDLAPLLMRLIREPNFEDAADKIREKLVGIVGSIAVHVTVPPTQGED